MSNKFVILGDCHLGARNASLVVAEFQIKFFEDQLFPYMKKHGISQILQLGDMFDTRKFSNHVVLHKWKTRVFDYMHANHITFVTLLGNHDIAAKNTLEVSSTALFLSEYDNVNIIRYPSEHDTFGVPFLIVPWICQENQELVQEMVKKTTARYCAGHFEFDGFEMHKGMPAHGGTPIADYDDFDMVFSGHFHTRSKKKNIQYVGTPYEMTWVDYGDQKGFHVFDVKKESLSFVPTNFTLFNKIEYNDKDEEPVDITNLKGTYVKVVVINKTDPYKFEKFIDKILIQEPSDLKISDIQVDFNDVDIEDELEVEDTRTLMTNFVKQLTTDLDSDELEKQLQRLYLDALEITV